MARRQIGRIWILLLLVVVAASACTTVVPLEPQECPGALLEGTLVLDERVGLAVHLEDVDVSYPVQWPDGWSVDVVDGEPAVVADGRVVGREGDRFSAGGGFTSGPDEVFQPCGGIEITTADG